MKSNSHVARLVAANVKRVRREAGVSQEDLSYRSDLHRTEVGAIEQGKRLPRVDTLAKIAGGLGIPPGELMRGIEWKPGEVIHGSFGAAPPVPSDGGGG